MDMPANDVAALEAAREVLARLRAAGYEAWIVGGAVRDRILGRKRPQPEYDVATSCPPEEVERLFPKTHAVGRAFGVVLVVLRGVAVQVATFRRDEEYRDGRRPVAVSRASLEGDAQRRDFTINALYWDPESDEIRDPVGGMADLRAGILRAIGEPQRRFEEDHLRMLRAVRFHCELGLRIEQRTLEAIRTCAPALVRISAERIREEFEKILLSDRAAEGVRLLSELGLLECFLPELERMKGVEQPPEYHPEGDVWTHTLLCMRYVAGMDFETRMATLLHDVGKPDTFRRAPDRIRFHEHDTRGAEIARVICRRLRLTTEGTRKVVWLVRYHLRLRDAPRMRRRTLRRLFAEPYYDDLVRLTRADILASHGDLSPVEFAERERAALAQEDRRPAPLVRGRDLIEMGFRPGPIFREIIRAAYDEQLEGRLNSPEEARRFVRERWGDPSQNNG
jgi:poly(A) polymerase